MSTGCEDRHASLATELRAVLLLAAERLGPLLDRARDGSAPADTCGVCPVCAVLALLRGERSEMAVRLADQAAGLLTVLRTALAEGDPSAWSTWSTWSAGSARPAWAPSAQQPGSERRVQHIPVDRPAASAAR